MCQEDFPRCEQGLLNPQPPIITYSNSDKKDDLSPCHFCGQECSGQDGIHIDSRLQALSGGNFMFFVIS